MVGQGPLSEELLSEELLGGQGSLERRQTEKANCSKPMWGIEKADLIRHASLPAPNELDEDEIRQSFCENVSVAAMSKHISGPRLSQDGECSELQSNGEAVVNLLNNCLGSGLLSVAFAVSQAGLAVSLGCIVFFMVLNLFTILLNLKSCQLANCHPGTCQIGQKTFGTFGRLFMTLIFVSQSFFVMVSYADACADGIMGLLGLVLRAEQIPSQRMVMIMAWLVLLAPTTLVRSMKSVARLSFIALIGGVLLIVSVVLCCSGIMATHGPPKLSDVDMMPRSAGNLFNGLSIFVFMFSIQPGAAAVLSSMQDTSEANVRKVCLRAFLIVMTLNVTLGFSCYTTFLSNTKGDLLLSFPNDLPSAISARFAMLVLVVLSYMIMSIPCKIPMLDLLFNKNETLHQASWMQYYGFTVVLNVLVIWCALKVSDLSLILGANGAVCSCFVALILPPMFYVKLCADPVNPGERVPVLSIRNLPYFLICLGGLFLMTVCGYQVVQRFLAAANSRAS